MRRLLSCLALVAAAGVAFAAAVYKVGDEVADVTLTMADGTQTKLSAHRDRTVLLFFYGTWGRRASDDAKAIDALRKARAKQKLTVIGVARDAKPEEAKKFADDHKLGFPQAVDAKSELYGKFATKGLPYVVLLDGDRKLKYSAAGVDEEAIETALTEQLGPKEPAEKKPDEEKSGGGKK